MAELPKGVERMAWTLKGQYALLILLDGYPYCEFTCAKSSHFTVELESWKRRIYPTLIKSVVRYFTLAPTGEIKELTFKI